MLTQAVYTKKRRGGKFMVAAASVSILAGLFLAGGTALAVHDTGAFELDGNAVSGTTDDWDRVCHEVVGSDCGTTSNTNGATAVSWVAEANLNSTIFTGGGSKDPQDVSSWAWKDGAGGLPDKDNLLHSFAARYSLAPSATCPSGGAPTCEVLYFGSDRYDNSGDAQQGFWFFQNPIGLGQNAVGGGKGFTGVHKTGDLLVISDFSNGGTTSTITVYSWDPTCKKAGGACGDANLRTLATSAAAKCGTSGAADAFCGIVNPGTITMPWSFTDKSGTANNGALNGEFYEGGINLSTLGLSAECFASVASETRSSTSTTATLKDFVLGGFGECDTTLETTPSVGQNGSTSITTAGSIDVTDSADLTINGTPAWAGTLDFYLCKVATTSDTCDSGGTQIGTTLNVSNSTTQPIVSDAATITAAANGTTDAPGQYCWRAEFTATTNGVPSKTDSSSTECFTVDPVQPTLTTNASGEVEIGEAISDTANLSGTANQPGDPVIEPTTTGDPAGGSITFKVYGPDDADCSGDVVHEASVDVSGDSSASNVYDDSFTPTAAGTYRWVASYSGDAPNTLGAAGACNDDNESVVVTPNQPVITTQVNHEDDQTPGTELNDTASISNLAAPSNGTYGTITFTAYGPEADATTCETVAYTSTIGVTVDGDYVSSDGDGGAFAPTAPGHYNWIAVYTPGSGDVNNLSATTACGDANEGSVIIQLQPTISTAQTFTIQDSATITVASGAGNLDGNVRFRLYDNATCDPGVGDADLLYDSGSIAVSGALSKTVDSDATTITTSQPVLSWLVEYTSNIGGHKDVTSSCATENSSVAIDNGS